MADPGGAALDAHGNDVNAQIRYTMYSVYRIVPGEPPPHLPLATALRTLDADVVLRGAYDVGGLRGDADLMLWWHGPSAESLQSAYRLVGELVETRLAPVWSQMGLHRPAEFNRAHVPAFLAGEPAGRWLCVYPFVRSYEWYLLEESERRELLAEHGEMGREFPDVLANTVASFALGDYEWLLAFEAEQLHRIVDLMRHLRGSGARRHVREETPFYTGRRISLDAVDALLAE
jgi:hydrogen peroxide-dependent heme synthase